MQKDMTFGHFYSFGLVNIASKYNNKIILISLFYKIKIKINKLKLKKHLNFTSWNVNWSWSPRKNPLSFGVLYSCFLQYDSNRIKKYNL